MKEFFFTIFYQPIFNLLMFLVAIMPGHDFGLAIIGLTIIIKLLMWPLSRKALKSQKALSAIQPKLKELKEKYKDDKEQQGKAMIDLYKQEKVSPTSSCLLVLVQLPFFIALYRSLMHVVGGDSNMTEVLYPFIANPGEIHPSLLGLVDLSTKNYVLALMAGAAQFWQSRMTVRQQQPDVGKESKDEETMAMVNKQMMYTMPIITVVIGVTLPAALSLYWFVMTLMTVGQQWWVMRDLKAKEDGSSGPLKGEVVNSK